MPSMLELIHSALETKDGSATNAQLIVDHLVDLARHTSSLRDCLKFVAFMTEGDGVRDALEEFVDIISPIVDRHVPASQRLALGAAIAAEAERLVREYSQRAASRKLTGV